MKKILSILLSVVMLLSNMVYITAVAQTPEKLYNYKMGFSAESDFTSIYPYVTNSKDLKPGDPPPPNIGKAFPDGKYGKCLELTPSGFLITNGMNYNSAPIVFKDEPINVGGESTTWKDFMQNVQSVSFWVHTPKTVPHRGMPAMDYRLVNFGINLAVEGEEKGERGFSLSSYKLPNSGEWEYLTIPMDDFKSDGVGLATYYKQNFERIITVKGFSVSFPYSYYFGTNSSGTKTEPDATTWPEGWISADGKITALSPYTPWKEPLRIDEMLFDCSTPGNPAITPPSSGEESYFNNADITGVTVDGVEVLGFDPEKDVNEIPVPENYTQTDILNKVAPILRCPFVSSSTTEQTKSGSTYEIKAPTSIPGMGSIIVSSASGKVEKTYNVKFVKSDAFQVFYNQITNLQDGSPLSSGNYTVSVPYANASADKSVSATMISVVRNIDTDEPVAVDVDKKNSIAPSETGSFSVDVSVPTDDSKYELCLYFVDNEGNFVSESFSSNTGIKLNAVTSGASPVSLSSEFIANDSEVSISGTAKSTKEGDTVIVYVYKPDGVTLANVFTESVNSVGAFSKKFPFTPVEFGKYTVKSYINGKSVDSSFFCVDETNSQPCIEDFNEAKTANTEEALIAFYDLYKTELGLSEDLFSALSDANKLKVLKDAKTATTLTKLRENIETMIVLQTLNQFSTLSNAKNIFEKHNDIARFDTGTSYFQTYVKTTAQIDRILTKVAAGKYDTIDEARAVFNDTALKEAINAVTTYSDIGTLLTENETQIGERMNYTKYDGLTSTKKDSFHKKIANEKITSLDALDTKLTDFLNDSPKPGPGPGPGSVTTPIKQVTEDKNLPSPSPEPTKPPETSDKFDDLGDVPWAVEAINALAEMNSISGRPNGDFDPNANVTREEFLKILLSTFSLVGEPQDIAFEDVDSQEWYATYIKSAVSLKITNGISETLFGVGQDITRQDMAVMMHRVLAFSEKEENYPFVTSFDDFDSVAEYAQEGVRILQSIKVINGVGDNKFDPSAKATRAEAAKMIYELYKYLKR